MSEDMEEIKKKIFKKNKSGELHISRVPEKTIKLFKEYANEEFCGDYGQCLKSLTDELLVKPPIYMGLQEQLQALADDLGKLNERIDKLEKSKSEDPKSSNKVIRKNGVRMINRKNRTNKEE